MTLKQLLADARACGMAEAPEMVRRLVAEVERLTADNRLLADAIEAQASAVAAAKRYQERAEQREQDALARVAEVEGEAATVRGLAVDAIERCAMAAGLPHEGALLADVVMGIARLFDTAHELADARDAAESALARVRGAFDWLALHAIVEEYATEEDGDADERDPETGHYLVFIDVKGARWGKRKYARDANRDAAKEAATLAAPDAAPDPARKAPSDYRPCGGDAERKTVAGCLACPEEYGLGSGCPAVPGEE